MQKDNKVHTTTMTMAQRNDIVGIALNFIQLMNDNIDHVIKPIIKLPALKS